MSDAAARPRVIIVMGVAGAGKTLVGSTFAKALGWSFYDADDFHSPENVAKMHHGIGLTDADRAPWLATLRDVIDHVIRDGRNAVMACSALKEAYRRVLTPNDVPDGAVGVGEPDAVMHLRHVFGRMKIVGVVEAPTERLRERGAHERLSCTGDAHHDDDPGPVSY